MKLKNYTATLEEKMSEFDMWVTPSLGEIRDTPQFKINLDQLKSGFDLLASITEKFVDCEHCSASSLALNTLSHITEKDVIEAQNVLDSICNVLLLATGKTDNNLKCQYPLLLRNNLKITHYPQKKPSGAWIVKPLPRTLLLTDVTKLIVQLSEKADFQEAFIKSYFQLIVSDEIYAKQLWSLGSAYISQKAIGNADSLISSIVIFQSRGSITATQGHIPEAILRNYLSDWGLASGSDYNTQDVEIGELLEGIVADSQIKRRKYDFVIPYQSRKSGNKIFIQGQFYAGDSGSVSHKVVDQTDSTREVTLAKFPEAVFIEFLDGAGYYASLNGDLRRMLAKQTTKDFIQLRTAPLKLRRELQDIQFLTTLEVEHAIIRTSGNKKEEVKNILNAEGYSTEEIEIAVENAVKHGLIFNNENNTLNFNNDRIEIIRKYCILDIIANHGEPVPNDKGTGFLCVAGYGLFWGLPQDKVIEISLYEIPKLDELWNTKIAPFNDIQWLLENGFILSK